jgi:hypothetical protein
MMPYLNGRPAASNISFAASTKFEFVINMRCETLSLGIETETIALKIGQGTGSSDCRSAPGQGSEAKDAAKLGSAPCMPTRCGCGRRC